MWAEECVNKISQVSADNKSGWDTRGDVSDESYISLTHCEVPDGSQPAVSDDRSSFLCSCSSKSLSLRSSGSVVNTAHLLWWFPVSFFWTNNFPIVCTASLFFCDCNHHCCNVVVSDDLWKERGSWQNQVIEMSTAGSRWYAVTSWFVCRVGCGDVWYKETLMMNTSWIVCEILSKRSRYFHVCQKWPDFFLS